MTTVDSQNVSLWRELKMALVDEYRPAIAKVSAYLVIGGIAMMKLGQKVGNIR